MAQRYTIDNSVMMKDLSDYRYSGLYAAYDRLEKQATEGRADRKRRARAKKLKTERAQFELDPVGYTRISDAKERMRHKKQEWKKLKR